MDGTKTFAQIFGQLASTVATYGIYALIVFLFWQASRIHKRLDAAREPAKALHYRRQSWALLALATLFLIAAGWLHLSASIDPGHRGLRGKLNGLLYYYQSNDGFVSHQISFEDNDRVYRRRGGVKGGKYGLGWMARTPNKYLIVTLQTQTQVDTPRPEAKDPARGVDVGPSRPTNRTRERSARIDLARRPANGSEYVHWYDTGTDCFFGRSISGDRYDLPWEDVASDTHMGAQGDIRRLLREVKAFLAPRALAQLAGSEPESSEQRRLALLLGDSDFEVQKAGRHLMTEIGSKAQPVWDSLLQSVIDARGADVAQASSDVLVHNLFVLAKGDDVVEVDAARLSKMAYAYYWVDDYERACELFELARDRHGSDDAEQAMAWEHRYAWGTALRHRDRFDEAQAQYRIALKVAPADRERAWTYNAMGLTASKRAKADPNARQEVRTHYEDAVALCRDCPAPLNNLAWELALGNATEKALQRALALSTRAVELEPGNANLLDTRGTILCKLGRRDEGVRLLQAAVDGAPERKPFTRRLRQCLAGETLSMDE
ncbi:MAG: hypothetical protein PVI30_06715 [Myxococcales bacterium]|jgi:tetratricopeptide (TPR) repeat protein